MEAAIRERVKQWVEKRNAEKEDDAENGDAATAEDVEKAFEEITELILDGRQFKTVNDADAALLKKMKKITKLACNQTGLTSVANFPRMPTVKSLELTDNHISGGIEELVKSFPNLKKLQLGGNHFKSYADIEPLKDLEHLEQLGLDMSPLSSNADYREKVFEMLPQLLLLDSQDKEGKEVDAVGSDDDEDEEEEEEEEEDEQEAADTTLRDFYEKDLEEEDDEDEEDFQPEGDEEEDDDDLDEEEEGDGDEDAGGGEREAGGEENEEEGPPNEESQENEEQPATRREDAKRKVSSSSPAEQLANGSSSEDQAHSTSAAKHARVE